jgi:hypothetical protein
VMLAGAETMCSGEVLLTGRDARRAEQERR